MSDAAVLHEPEPARFSEVLRGLAEAPGERLSINDIVQVFGERAFGALMLFVGLLNLLPLPPGGTTVTGAPLLFLSFQLAVGRETLWLPRWMCRTSVSRAHYREGLEKALPWLERAERLTRPRLAWVTGDVGERLIGLACFLLSCVLVLPIFLGNIAPAIAIVLLSLGLIQRDGLMVLLGWFAVAVAVGLLVLAWSVIVATATGVLTWFVERF